MWRTCRAVGHAPVTLRLPPVLRGCRAQFPHAVPHRQPRGGVPRKASARGALSGAPFRRGGTCSGHGLAGGPDRIVNDQAPGAAAPTESYVIWPAPTEST